MVGGVLTSAASLAGNAVFSSAAAGMHAAVILRAVCDICDFGIRCLRFIGARFVISTNFGRPTERIGTAIAIAALPSLAVQISSYPFVNLIDGLCFNSSSLLSSSSGLGDGSSSLDMYRSCSSVLEYVLIRSLFPDSGVVNMLPSFAEGKSISLWGLS